MADADRSSIEIKVLLKNLDPTKPSIKHKDRLRRLNKFRNYVTAKPLPEFYDDDYSLLLLGSESPTAMEDEDLSHMNLTGLLRAAGCPSTDHKDSLKRSARPTISLLRYLCLEYEASSSNVNNILDELNGFAAALCALNVPQLRTLRLDIHIGKGDNESGSRGGSKDDACHLLALILARHTDTDYETPKPLTIQIFLPESRSQAEFETWLGENASPDVRRAIKENVVAAEGGGKVGGAAKATSAAAAEGKGMPSFDDDEDDDDDVLGAFTSKKATPKKGGGSQSNYGQAMEGDLGGGMSGAVAPDGKPTIWSATQMASKKERASGAIIFLEEEREKATAERKKAEEEKQRLLGRDPLGLRSADRFDLLEIDSNRDFLIQKTLKEIEEEIDCELALASESGVERVNWLEAQRQALLAIVDEKKRSDKGGEGAESNELQQDLPSILPTNPDFDPTLFLTLVHRNATYQELQESTSRLSRKTDNQVERLQNLVRDNFALFIKCSEGIDVFADQRDPRNNRNSRSRDMANDDQGMQELQNRFGTLDGLASSCSEQARKSFKPLLDNTNEVRKVQSALAVLQRVAPLLQVPSLMRQHIENANFSSVVKAYRKVLVIDKNHCDVDLLQYVRAKAGDAAQDARQDLELILADEASSANSLLDAIRDLGELLELLEEEEDSEVGNSVNKGGVTPRSSGQSNSAMDAGTFTIDRHVVICIRDYPPALGCLFLQTSHFRSLVDKAVAGTEATAERVFRGEGPDNVSNQSSGGNSSSDGISAGENSSSQRSSRDKRWKFEVLETRVDATLRAVTLAKNWLPRLLQIGLATQEAEKRRMARHKRRKMSLLSATASNSLSGESDSDAGDKGTKIMMSAHDVFKSIVNPALTRLVEYVAYCSLGCPNQGSKYKISAVFGRGSAERLRAILKSPLPPTQTAKCALDLAELADAIQESNEAMLTIRSLGDDGEGAKVTYRSPLEKCSQLTNDAVVMIEQRVCIYSFDACARKCSISASGSGVFDGDALLQCVQKLSDDLTRSDECSKEVEKGCLLVSKKCCEGLSSYVKDRSDAARLRVVAECADALNTTIADVVREVSYLTNGQSESLESNLSSVISTLEREMFDVFLESVKRNVSSCARLGLIENPSENDQTSSKVDEPAAPFPPYLAASFLTIVRCRAQVERALRDLRRSDGTTYQFLALQTASDGVVENICLELKSKMNRVRPHADVFSIHLQFLISTLKKYLSDEILSLASDTRRMLLSASTGGRGVGRGMGNGPEGLTALENLERLGRVYVMCLGE
mmetsp:Transcript_21876/g.47536  ORF Transcript_21876/g.47536 Transcript_21876/m.47536 type:complete len:1286 (-) Transcript_21876:286-4143(-)|eukprot:CAMPEP_0172309182 /NCGR_PEP_ID=MMETSP1058-20130122/9546_1 /TAXON_ID=83371 /ORGANISM="Detonula confervacea, Strain CCMP 353" /LENGTH=1285 /DNA_ID=CAMNT_0013021761 /DNA_START=95 /DNA_END=3952 /DNA_ORIENTATION=-